MLTTRASFVAGSLQETLRQVREGEVVTPRELNPDVPRDLETVCLKCLERGQARRCAQVGELAALSEAGRIRPGLDLRNEALAALIRFDIRPVDRWEIRKQGVPQITFDFSPDGRWVASAHGRFTVLREVASGRVVDELDSGSPQGSEYATVVYVEQGRAVLRCATLGGVQRIGIVPPGRRQARAGARFVRSTRRRDSISRTIPPTDRFWRWFSRRQGR